MKPGNPLRTGKMLPADSVQRIGNDHCKPAVPSVQSDDVFPLSLRFCLVLLLIIQFPFLPVRKYQSAGKICTRSHDLI